MNLAIKDIQYNLGRFGLTALGIGMLLMIVMGMGGIYRGLIEDATLLVEKLDADLWVVQRATRGPFAEISRVSTNLADRVTAVAGVESARRFVFHTIQREYAGRPLRMAVTGVDFPSDQGEWLPLVAGRPLANSHYELIADRSLGLDLGNRLKLGKNTYTVVGLTAGMISSSGDGLAFFTVSDALAIQFDVSGEASRLERAARRNRAEQLDLTTINPALLDRAAGESAGIPVLPPPALSAVLVRLLPGADRQAVQAIFDGWADVTAHTREEECNLLLSGLVEKSRLQLALFRFLLTVISAIVMALILYTMTLDKLQPIALLKMIGAPNRVILGMILQQALILGALGYVIAYVFGQWLFPRFPRRVILTPADLVELAVIVLAISVFASLLGMWKAASVSPNQALSG